MPKKRFTNQYSKPPSSAHPSLISSSSSSTVRSDVPPSVNELISSLRKSQVSSEKRERGTSTAATPTLPPQIRHLLSQPETPIPKPRVRERFGADGRRLPAGPAPPRSWLEGSRYATREVKSAERERLYPEDVGHLPGLGARRVAGARPMNEGKDGRTLLDTCLRRMAIDWEFVQEFEMHNLADLPTRLRMLLLRNIAVYGPEDGIGFEGLRSIIIPSEYGNDIREDRGDHNSEFHELDLSGSVGRSISFRQLTELVDNPIQQAKDEEDSWEDTLMRPLSPLIPHLTHLSISHPPATISWPKFLQFAKHVPTLTHLSLAHWPVPSLTPNSKTTVMSSKYGKDVQYGATNYYSHSLDHDFREAASILRRLASTLYGLEYLDITGCTEWARALLWKGAGEYGVDWATQWMKMKELKILSSIHLTPTSSLYTVSQYILAYKEISLVRLMMTKERRSTSLTNSTKKTGSWIDITRDDFRHYEALWKHADVEEEKKKRDMLDQLNDWKEKEAYFGDTVGMSDDDALARSIWDQ